MLTFMDMESYEQIELAADFVGDQAQFLQDGMRNPWLQLYEDKPIGIKLPVQVTLTVTRSRSRDEGRHRRTVLHERGAGDGMKIQVPPFVGAGEKIIVATETALTCAGQSEHGQARETSRQAMRPKE